MKNVIASALVVALLAPSVSVAQESHAGSSARTSMSTAADGGPDFDISDYVLGGNAPRPGNWINANSNAPQAAGDNSVFCGNGEMFYWYEEDANGNEVPGTRQYGCDYD